MKKLVDQYSTPGNFRDMDLEQKIMSRSSEFRVPGGTPASEALLRLKSAIAEKERAGAETMHAGRSKVRLIYLLTSLAAGFLLFFAIRQFLSGKQPVNVLAQNGSRIEYRLPDGSEVNINAGSRIAFDKKDFSNRRRLTLEGEAFFKVQKGSGFTVSTSRGSVEVLGTSFNVYSRANAFKVSCLTGRVMVTSGNRSITIIPGESAELKGADLVSYTDAGINKVNSWIDGEFTFSNSPLSDVFDEIGRQFNITFAGRNFDSRFFTGSFTNKDLHEALDIVCIPLGLSYEIGNKGVVLVSDKRK